MSATRWVTQAPSRLRNRAQRVIRHSVGLTENPPPFCNDPDEAYFPVDGIARIVHGDLSSMLVGGLGSLFFQMLHPSAMAGVAQHSRYQHDPLGRLLQTANFISHTTYGSRGTAYADIERVLAVHQAVRGTDDGGRPYYANDPHLLAWVHACETSMFLTAYQRFGALTITNAQADAYVLEMSTLARDLGAESPPTSVKELNAVIESFRPELRLCADGVEARNFVAHDVVHRPAQQLAYWLLVQSSYALMAPWTRTILGISTKPAATRWIIRRATSRLCYLIRLAIPPPRPVAWTAPGRRPR